MAFCRCSGFTEVEFGDTLETIGESAFYNCTSLTRITMPCVRNIGNYAFANCRQLMDLELPEGLETIGEHAFHNCQRLGRISIPLKDGMIEDDAFAFCSKLSTVDLVGGIHNTIASLHLENWRNEMNGEINRINQTLPNTTSPQKTINQVLPTTNSDENTEATIQQWIRSVIRQIGHYKTEHKALLKEATTLLELALWKAKIEEKEEDLGEVKAKKAKIDVQSKRSERHITSGANIVIKNVLPFLELK